MWRGSVRLSVCLSAVYLHASVTSSYAKVQSERFIRRTSGTQGEPHSLLHNCLWAKDFFASQLVSLSCEYWEMEGISRGGAMVMGERQLKLKDQLGLYYTFRKILIFCLKALLISVRWLICCSVSERGDSFSWLFSFCQSMNTTNDTKKNTKMLK